MAFRAPTHHAPQRLYASTSTAQDNQFAEASPASNARLDDSQEWILFSPAQPSATGTLLSHTISTDQTGHTQTAGRSRLSDYGSLGTEVRSWEAGANDLHTPTVQEESDEELDSLDSHLLEFRSQESSGRYDGQRKEQHIGHGLLSAHLSPEMDGLEAASMSILPAHDGLGSFQLSRRAASDGLRSPVEQHQNPQRRVKRRRESLDLILAREQTERQQEEEREREKRTRIEEWRMEQSRAIMEEVQKESRRQRQRLAGRRTNSLREYHEGEMASMGGIAEAEGWAAGQPSMSEHTEEEKQSGNETFWARITRRVIQDLMGIDDKLLSILFGESLPNDFEHQMNGSTPANPLDGRANDSAWENRLLERIARELGLLVNQISDHPGAFSTYLKVQQAPLPYAGLPIIPESAADTKEEQPIVSPIESSATQRSNIFFPTLLTAASKHKPAVVDPISSSRHYFDSEMDYIPAPAPAAPLLRPTQNLAGSEATNSNHLPSYSVHALASQDASPTSRATTSAAGGFTKEEWEKQLDIGLVFKYLRSRFSSRKAPTHPTFQRHHSSPADQAARAARVRQHHPLVAGRPIVERRSSYKVVVPATAAGVNASASLQRRRSSSCASQSTKVSAGQRSRRLSGSSRCYWDIGCGGSLGSGSIIVSTGGMGGWGDV